MPVRVAIQSILQRKHKLTHRLKALLNKSSPRLMRHSSLALSELFPVNGTQTRAEYALCIHQSTRDGLLKRSLGVHPRAAQSGEQKGEEQDGD